MTLDTSPVAKELQTEILRKMTSVERLKVAIGLSELTRKLAFARIEQAHPGISGPALVREFLLCILSEDDHPAGLK